MSIYFIDLSLSVPSCLCLSLSLCLCLSSTDPALSFGHPASDSHRAAALGLFLSLALPQSLSIFQNQSAAICHSEPFFSRESHFSRTFRDRRHSLCIFHSRRSPCSLRFSY